jgi:hypothetical protein
MRDSSPLSRQRRLVAIARGGGVDCDRPSGSPRNQLIEALWQQTSMGIGLRALHIMHRSGRVH